MPSADSESSGTDTESNVNRKTGRRTYLTLAGSAAIACLAGCSGSDNDGTPTGGASGKKYSGVTIEFWDVLNVQSQAARAALEDIVRKFEQETGARVVSNFSSYQQLQGAKWINAFERGDQPNIYTSETEWSAKFVAAGLVKPFDQLVEEHADVVGDSVVSSTEWIYPVQQYNGRGYVGDHIWEMPIGCLPRTSFVIRTDHFEQVGLDPQSDFPPKNYQDAIDMATTLQQDGPAQYGFHIYGSKWDWFDIAHPWAVAQSGQHAWSAGFLNKDWTDINYEKDAWMTAMQQYRDVYQKYELSGPTTPTAGDEQMVNMLIDGTTSMAMPEWLNHPTFLRRAPEMMQDGTLQWASTWAGENGLVGPMGLWTMGIPQKPDGVNATQWKKKEKAAMDFMANYLLSKDFQAQLTQTLGLLPIREDIWQRAKKNSKWENGHRMVTTALDMVPKSDEIGWDYHQHIVPIMFNRIAPKVQKMLQGEMTSDQVCHQAAKEIRSRGLLDYQKNPLNE